MQSTFTSFQLFNFLSFTLQVQTIHKINEILLISLQILIKSFASNIIIDLSYSLSINSINTFENCLKWVVYINTLWSPCIAWESCSNFAYPTTVYFNYRKWIYKTVYCIRCLMVFKTNFCSEFSDIPSKAGRNTGNWKALCVSRKLIVNTGNWKALCVSRKLIVIVNSRNLKNQKNFV